LTSDFGVFVESDLGFLAVWFLEAADVFFEFCSSSELLSSELLLESAFGGNFGVASCVDSFEPGAVFTLGALVLSASLSDELSEELEENKLASDLPVADRFAADLSGDFGVAAGV